MVCFFFLRHVFHLFMVLLGKFLRKLDFGTVKYLVLESNFEYFFIWPKKTLSRTFVFFLFPPFSRRKYLFFSLGKRSMLGQACHSDCFCVILPWRWGSVDYWWVETLKRWRHNLWSERVDRAASRPDVRLVVQIHKFTNSVAVCHSIHCL